MDNLTFSLNTLEWAANNISMQLRDVVSKISVSERTQEKLLNGKFSVTQAEKFAEITKVPFGTLFLDTPPKLYKPEVPDLRQKVNAEPLSELFYEVLKDIKNKQEWYTEFLQEHGAEELKFVGKFKDSNLQEYRLVANDIRSTLNIAKIKRNSTNRDNYLKLLIERCEDAGILVFKNGVVKMLLKRYWM